MPASSSLRLIVADRDEASRQAADLLAGVLRTESPVLGLATGSSVEAVYEELAILVSGDPELQSGVSRAQAFALDEYIGLPPDDANSYRATLLRQFAEPVGLAPDHLHLPSPQAVAAAYDDEIARAGGIRLQLLGIGSNGHIGFNEPGSLLNSRTRLVDLDERTRRDNARFFGALDAVPMQAITQGIGTILNAATLVVLAFGSAKAEALTAAILGPVTPDLPASALQHHPDVIVLADEEASRMLRPGG
ncbi:glucosamine-6-phosphate deaminase [Gryllotalpicola sp.]|uniref:glucosamine-6-phosphate deaminase n=1 Tax=Gryllotalpicola sp. TaxID=1932787 RepID=UPI002635AC30|nr:glucosamine-6-phosphate deaminase [Gryllotalpicola sp.]